MQTVIFVGSSKTDLRDFPKSVRAEIGRQILRMQMGIDPTNWKPMKAVGQGVREIRVSIKGQYRAFYVSNVGNAIYDLHAFQKKGQKTSAKDIAKDIERGPYPLQRNR